MSRSDVQPRIARLLLKALDSLEPGERSEVLEQIVARGLSGPDAPRGLPPDYPDLRTLPLEFAVPVGVAPSGGQQRMFPVRLRDRDHTRLKAWCDTNNFPMAVVVRGLIERFLDRQDELTP
jgi:hypothetical protein